jgi:membrane protease YdiL (CAAX protease family)
VQELMFRGVALGIFLRALPTQWAIAVSALLFALAHFLVPLPGVTVADPDAAGIGWEMLAKIWAQLAQPRVVLSGFLPMLALGWVLAAARVRTRALWLPIGLHAGWIFGNSMVVSPSVLPWSAVWFPLAAILLAAWFAGILTKPANDSFVCRI